MATQLFLVTTVADTHLATNNATLVGNTPGWQSLALATARGAGVTQADGATVAGPTAGLEVSTGVATGQWISPPVSADVTIAGTITGNIWAAESNMSANVSICMVVEVIRANTLTTQNSNTLVEIGRRAPGAEIAVTTRAVNNFTFTPTSTVVNRGDRIRVRVFGDDTSIANMASGFTFNIGYAGTTAAADGDTYVTFTEDFSFESAPAGSQLFLTNVQSGLTYGSTVPALVSDFTGSDESPLSEGGNWANLNSSASPLQRISNAFSGSAAGVCQSYWTPANFGPDLEAYVSCPTVGTIGIAVRVQGEGGAGTWDGYAVLASTGTTATISRVDNGSFTTISTGGATPTWLDGDKIGIRCEGSSIQLWRERAGAWTLLRAATDTTYASAGKIGLVVTGTTARGDDFYAGTDTNLFTADAPALISDFTGSDENPLSEGGNWAIINSSAPTHVLKRISNAVAGVTDTGTNISYWTPANFGPDLEAYFTISTLNGAVGIITRIQGEGGAGTWDGYRCYATASDTVIGRYTNAVHTAIISTGVGVFATGDKFGVRLEGSTIQIWRQASGSSDWNLVVTAVDTTYASAGKIGIFASFSTVRIDDFYAATDSNLFTQKAWTSRGAGVVSYLSDTDAGWTAPLYTTDWYTPELEAFTLTGMAVGNLRLLVSSLSANASYRCEIARVDADGTNATVWASWCLAPTGSDQGELALAETARTFNVSGDDLAFTDGQRIRIRTYVEDMSSVALVNAHNVQTFYNGTSAAASGDSYVTFAQSLTEFAGAGEFFHDPLRVLQAVNRSNVW